MNGTRFEAPHGVTDVEIRGGFAQVHVPLPALNRHASRIEVLRILAEAGISHKYLKLAQDGLAFVITEEQVIATSSVLAGAGIAFELNEDRSIVLVRAAGMWEGSGMIASIVAAAYGANVGIDHVGDMHDKMFLVVKGEVPHPSNWFVDPALSLRITGGGQEECVSATVRGSTEGEGVSRAGCNPKIKVLKFGGTSLATKEARAAAAQRVFDAKEQGFAPIAVVSAIGRKGAPYATDTLIGEYRSVNPLLPATTRELDLIMACGEIISAAIFTQECRSLGLNASALTGNQAGISTDGRYGSARIVAIEPKKILDLVRNEVTPVICGFQGFSNDDPDEITTLGRGGTDTTAAAIGAAVGASSVEIYTDVDGIKTADPDSVPSAPTLRQVSYDEVAELAHLGAKVLHPRSAEIAMRYSIPLWVKNSFSGDEGTEIVAEDVSYSRNVTGITHSGKLIYLQFDLSWLGEPDRAKLQRQLFSVLSRFEVGLYVLNLSSTGVGFAVTREQFPSAEKLLDGLVFHFESVACVLQLGSPSNKVVAQLEMLPQGARAAEAEKTEGCTMISVIGRTYFGMPGVFYRILSVLHREKIQVFQTADSDFSVSFLIPEIDTLRAVRVLHEELVG